MSFIYRLLEPLIQAAITHRLIDFHDALISRGQIPSIPPVSADED